MASRSSAQDTAPHISAVGGSGWGSRVGASSATMYAFSGGALLKDVEKARQEMDQQNEHLGLYRRQMMARAEKKREKAELQTALKGKRRLLSAAARSSVQRLNRGHGEDSARVADEELIESTFRRFDADGSGAIDVSELGDALQMVLGKRPSRETVKQLFEIADQDGNGTLDFEEFRQLARQGELVNWKLLNPKYRFLMQARHERAAERDAQTAAIAAKKAQIEEAGRAIDVSRREWETVCEARRRENHLERKRQEAAKKQWLEGRDRSTLHKQAMDAKRRAAALRSYRKMVHYQAGLVRAKREAAKQSTILDVCQTTMVLVDQDAARKRVTQTLGLKQQRYYVGAQNDSDTLSKSDKWRQPFTMQSEPPPLFLGDGSLAMSADAFSVKTPHGADDGRDDDEHAAAARAAAASPAFDGADALAPSPARDLGSPLRPVGFDPSASVTFHPSVQFNDLQTSSVLSPAPLFDPSASASVLSPVR